MHRTMILVAAFSAAACSGTNLTDATAPVTPVPGTYVLASMGTLTSAPFVTMDLMCGANRVHRQELMLGDTITIRADGTSREAFVTQSLENGAVTDSSHLMMDGWWASFNPAGYAFFDGYPSFYLNDIVVIRTGGTGSVTNRYRVEADGSISRPDGTGASCDGDSQPVQRFTSTWKRI